MKKRALSLLEIMIVIFLITLITGTIGYSMRGTLDKGRAFRTEQAAEQLRDLLLICLAEGTNAETLLAHPVEYLKASGLAKDPEKLLKDGWNEDFRISLIGKADFRITSDALGRYKARQGGGAHASQEADDPS